MTDHYILTKIQVEQGIKYCFDKAKILLNECDYLFQNKRDMNIILGLYTFSLEEFGKSLILKDHLSKPKKEYHIPIRLFGKGKSSGKSHKDKVNRALNELPDDCKRFFPAVRKVINTNTKTETVIVGPDDRKVSITAGTTGIFIDNSDKNDIDFHDLDFGDDYLADPLARMRCFYVDWDDDYKHWKPKLPVSKKNMQYLISELKKRIDE